MVRVSAGEFAMGNDEGAQHEKPKHKVFLDSYYIDLHEVTNAEYHAFWIADGGENSAHTPVSYGDTLGVENWPKITKTKPDYPVVGVSWHDALAYAKWADKRLPTEAEWEKAARGTDSRLWPWGNAFSLRIRGTKVHANVWDSNDGYQDGLAPVGTYPTGASPCGVLDMAGNVWEWVADWYSESYYHWGPSRNPKGPRTRRQAGSTGRFVGKWSTTDTMLQSYGTLSSRRNEFYRFSSRKGRRERIAGMSITTNWLTSLLTNNKPWFACLVILLAPPIVHGDMPQVEFTDVTAGAGIKFRHVNGAKGDYHLPETMGAGGAFFDYDTDGNLDLYLINSGGFNGYTFRGKIHECSLP